MKKVQQLLGLIIGFLVFSSCGNKVYVQKDPNVDFSQIKTYAWVAAQKDSLTRSAKLNNLANNRMRASFDKNLAESGLKLVRHKPDVLLVYDVNVKRENVSVTDPVYSQPLTRWFYNPYRGTYTAMYYPTQLLGYDNRTELIHEGTFTLTIMNARTEKTIWQGWTTAEVNGRRLTDKEIDENVKAIVKKLEK